MNHSSLSNSIRLGDLVVRAGLATEEEILQSHQEREKDQFIGAVLVTRGFLSPDALNMALRAQSLIRDGRLTLERGAHLLELVAKGHSIPAELLKDFEFTSISPSNRLGSLLLDAELVSEAQLHSAMAVSAMEGLPVGQILVRQQLISDAILSQALDFQTYVRDRLLDRETAVAQLRESTKTTDHTVEVFQVKHHIIRLGELLVVGKLIERSCVLRALEFSLEGPKRFIGERLIENGSISEQAVNYALILQSMVDQHAVQPLEACSKLSKRFSVQATQPKIGDQVRLSVETSGWDIAHGNFLLPPGSRGTVITLSELNQELEVEFDLGGKVIFTTVSLKEVERL